MVQSLRLVLKVIIDAYAKFQELTDASSLFWGMEDRDQAVWCALLVGLQ